MKESRFVVLGAGGVGKTSLVVQFLEGHFSNTYKPTVEDCYQHAIQMPDGISHTVEILDTAGSHHFPAMRELSIRSGRGFLLVFSVDSLQSFREVVQLWELVNRLRGSQIPIILVGNKSDLTTQRQVSHQVAAQTAMETMENCKFIETSAKYNVSVDEVFLELLQMARSLEEEQEAILEEEQALRKKRRHRTSKKLLGRKLSCLGPFAFSMRSASQQSDVSQLSQSEPDGGNQKCVLF